MQQSVQKVCICESAKQNFMETVKSKCAMLFETCYQNPPRTRSESDAYRLSDSLLAIVAICSTSYAPLE